MRVGIVKNIWYMGIFRICIVLLGVALSGYALSSYVNHVNHHVNQLFVFVFFLVSVVI